jgi:hypothetical protein
MAKFGYLFLHEGEGDGLQIVSSEWAQAATSNQAGTRGYGYQWWIGDGFYSASGIGGQRIFVNADLDMVVVTTAQFQPENIAPSATLARLIFDTVESDEPLPENPDGMAMLTARVEAVSTPDPQPALPLPEIANEVDEQRYVLDENEYGWEAFVLEFDGDEARITMETGGEVFEFPIGMNGAYRLSQDFQQGDVSSQSVLAVRGEWLVSQQNVFNIYMENPGDLIRFRIQLEFEGDTVEIDVRVTSAVNSVSLTGRREP